MASRKRAPASPAKAAPMIAKTMTVRDIIERFPASQQVLTEYGLHCFGCAFNDQETIEEGCLSHGFHEQDLTNLLSDLEDVARSAPPRPHTLTITQAAAQAIATIAEKEKKQPLLSVIVNEHGGFCMEFRAPHTDDHSFAHADVPHVKLFASSLTLDRIGGATIDFRDQRFKLDLESTTDACGCGGKCDCA